MDGMKLLRAPEVAAILGLSRSQVYGLLACGRLPALRIGRSVRVPLHALEQWIAQNTQGPAASNGDSRG